jgi:hypothetical protein
LTIDGCIGIADVMTLFDGVVLMKLVMIPLTDADT